jgi:hypothetical protein
VARVAQTKFQEKLVYLQEVAVVAVAQHQGQVSQEAMTQVLEIHQELQEVLDTQDLTHKPLIYLFPLVAVVVLVVQVALVVQVVVVLVVLVSLIWVIHFAAEAVVQAVLALPLVQAEVQELVVAAHHFQV